MEQRSYGARVELIVLRHATTEANTAGMMPGQLDVPLTVRGRAEAARAAVWLARLGVASILSSDLSRAAQTASEVGAVTGVPLTLEPRLRETDMGRWEGLTRGQAAELYPEEYREWRAGGDVARGGGETQAAVGQRAVQAIQQWLPGAEQATGPTVVVTHAGTARGLIGSLLGLPVPYWRTLATLGNAAWSRLGRDHLGWQLLGHNESAEHGELG